MLEFIDGYKTYIVAVLLGCTAAAEYLGWITPDLREAIVTFLIGSGLAALRHGIKKAEG